jgi:integrase
VFTRENGSPIHPDYFQRAFDRHVRDSGLPGASRSTAFDTPTPRLLKEAELHPKTVSERLGHSSVAFTMDVHSHLLSGMQREAAEARADTIFGPRV